MSEHIKRVATEIERGTAKVGWDRPPSLYALVSTAKLLDQPDLPADIAEQVRAEWDGSADHLSAILQEQLPEDNLEEFLPQLAWPDEVSGVAVAVERYVVPPSVQDAAPEDPEEAAAFVAAHPDKTDVRLVVAALRSGETWSLIRSRSHDTDDSVASGPNLVPLLTDLLRASLTPDSAQEG